MLLGAARVAAPHIGTGAPAPRRGLRLQQNLLTSMLANRLDPRTPADNIGADVHKPAAVAAFAHGRRPREGAAGR